jgi:serine/threonine-protein kinase
MRNHADPETDTETLRVPAVPRSPQKIDRYELKELIGCGGMGAVYRAVDVKLGRTVALKTAMAKRAGARLTDRVRQRFLREAMALSKVEHRNVVQVLDFGFADDGTPFLVMEHLKGRDLGVLLAESERPLPVTDVVDIMLGVCAALRACHRVGIIHRDLKPGNIFLAETDTGKEVKVLDFGVSKAPTADDLTREGQILGTPQYLAPEQVDGKVGPASDQYALGVLLYVCLTLRLPYEDHQDRGLLRAIEAGRFEPPHKFRPDLPQALEAIVLRAMHVSPSERFESVYALGQRLWELASPRAQEEWRGYYHPQSRIARALAPAVLGNTQILEGSRDDAPPEDCGDLFRSSTVAAPAATPGELEMSGDRAPPQERSAELRSPRGPRFKVVVTAAVVLFVGGWSLARLRAPRRSPPHLPTRLAPAPEIARQRVPEAIVVPLATPTPAPPPAAPREPSELTPEPRHVRPPRAHHPPRRTDAPFENALPNIDPAGIGIPSD